MTAKSSVQREQKRKTGTEGKRAWLWLSKSEAARQAGVPGRPRRAQHQDLRLDSERGGNREPDR